MNWNTIYHTYEGFATLLVITCFGGIIGSGTAHHTQDTQHLYETLERAKNMVSLGNNSPWVKEFVRNISLQDKGHQYLPRFQQARLLTQNVIAKLEQHKKYLAQHPMDAIQPVDQYLIRERKGYAIEQTLDDFVKNLNQNYKDLQPYKFWKITSGNKHSPLYQSDSWFVEKDFVHTAFDNTTVAEALAVITQKQTVVLRYGREILRRLPPDPHYYGCWISSIPIGISSLQDEVQVGDTIKMEMFVGEPLQTRKRPWYYVEINGKPVRLQDGAYTNIQFKTTGQGKKHWNGKIRYCEEGVEPLVSGTFFVNDGQEF